MSNRESADDYSHVIAQLSDRYRVILCKDNIQWIVQKAEKTSHGRAWRGIRYFRTKKALVAFCGGLERLSDLSQLDILPDNFSGKVTEHVLML